MKVVSLADDKRVACISVFAILFKPKLNVFQWIICWNNELEFVGVKN